MLRLVFRVPANAEPVSFEAREGFKIIGPLVLRCPESDVVARFSNRSWQVDGRNAAGLECTQLACVRFSDSEDSVSDLLGPFNHVRFQQGSCYGDGILIAEMVVTTERWRHCETGLRWRSILIVPGPS